MWAVVLRFHGSAAPLLHELWEWPLTSCPRQNVSHGTSSITPTDRLSALDVAAAMAKSITHQVTNTQTRTDLLKSKNNKRVNKCFV